MKILLTGAAGQLGHALRQQVPVGVELIATSRSGDPATGLLPLDLADAMACRTTVLEHRPDWVLNAGAYGRTKAAGEEAVEQVLGDTGRCSETTTYDPRSSYSAKPHARQTRTRLQ